MLMSDDCQHDEGWLYVCSEYDAHEPGADNFCCIVCGKMRRDIEDDE